MEYLELPSHVSYVSLRDISEASSKADRRKSYREEVMGAKEALMKGSKAIEEFVAQASAEQLNILWQESETLSEPVCCGLFQYSSMQGKSQEHIKSHVVKKILDSSDQVIQHIKMIAKLTFKDAIVDKIVQKQQKKRFVPLPAAQAMKLSKLAQGLPVMLVLDLQGPEEYCRYILAAHDKQEQERRVKFLHGIASNDFERFVTSYPLTEKARITKALFSLISLERSGKSIADFAQDIAKMMKESALDVEYSTFILTQLKNLGQIIPTERQQLSTKILQILLPPVRPNLRVVIPPDKKIKGGTLGREYESISNKMTNAIKTNNIHYLTNLLLPPGTPRAALNFTITYRELIFLYRRIGKKTKEIDALIIDISTNHRQRLKRGMSDLLRDMVISFDVSLNNLYWFIAREDVYQSVDEKDADIQEALKLLKSAKGGLDRAHAIATWWQQQREGV